MKKSYIVTGLGFGDEGKGTIVDYLTKLKRAELVVKFNGGSQAAHNVHTIDGRHHTFSQFGSGSFHYAKTLLTNHVFVDPLAMISEGNSLSQKLGEDAFNLMYIQESCPIITPYHKQYNLLLEMSRNKRNHGSCGVGHGITVEMMKKGYETLYVSDLKSMSVIIKKLVRIRDSVVKLANENGFSYYDNENQLNDLMIVEYFQDLFQKVNIVKDKYINKLLKESETVIFEGSQGALLDEHNGFNPYTTYSTTTRVNADEIISDYSYKNMKPEVHSIGVMRTYSTRHGNGPFLSKNNHYNAYIFKDDNEHNENQGEFRSGYLDLVMLKYSLSYSNVDSIALTHYDVSQDRFNYVKNYKRKPDVILDYNFKISDSEDIYDFKHNSNKSMDYSYAVTELLFNCEPIIDFNRGRIFDFIEKELNHKISILSYGITFLEKQMVKEI